MKLNLTLDTTLIARALVGQRVRLRSSYWEDGYRDGTIDSFDAEGRAFYFRAWHDADEKLGPFYRVALQDAHMLETTTATWRD